MANYTVLLIDYEPRSIERARAPLTAAGYRVHVATDGLSGIAKFAEIEPGLVLVEAMIPKKHGFEVCQDLKRTPQGKRTPVIIMTSVYKGRKYRSQALHIHQCDEYIEKPISDDQLVGIVRRFLGEPEGVFQPDPEPAAAETSHAAAGLLDSINDDEIAEIEIVDYDAPESQLSERPEPRRAPPAPEPRRPAAEPPAGSHPLNDLHEAEIMERLDAILSPDAAAPAPRTEASVAIEPPQQAEIVNFNDAKRARKRKQRQAKTATGSATSASSASPAAAVATQPRFERSAQVETSESPAPAVSALVEPAPRAEAHPVSPGMPWNEPETPHRALPAWVWGAVALALAVGGYLLIRGGK